MNIKCLFGHDWEYDIDENYKVAFRDSFNKSCPRCQIIYGTIRKCKRCGKKQIKYHFDNYCAWYTLY